MIDKIFPSSPLISIKALKFPIFSLFILVASLYFVSIYLFISVVFIFKFLIFF